MVEETPRLLDSDERRKGTLWISAQTFKAGQRYVKFGEQHHMNAMTIADKVESESNDESVIMSFQYLKINNNKAVKSGKLSKDSVLLDTGSTCSVFTIIQWL